VLDEVLVPWVADSIEQDAVRLSRWRADGPAAPARREDRLSNGELYGAAHFEPDLWRRFNRMQQVLEQPDAVLGDPAVVARVRALPARSVGRVQAPSRDDLVELVASCATPRRLAVGMAS
jgi:hypothetical protein